MYIWDRAYRPIDNVMFMGPTKWQQWDQVERFQMKGVKLLWALIWLRWELHNGNATQWSFHRQHYSSSGVKWKREDWSVRWGGGTRHKWVRMLNHCGMWKPKRPWKTWKNEKWWVTPQLFRVHRGRPPKYYIKEAESFIFNKLAR